MPKGKNGPKSPIHSVTQSECVVLVLRLIVHVFSTNRPCNWSPIKFSRAGGKAIAASTRIHNNTATNGMARK